MLKESCLLFELLLVMWPIRCDVVRSFPLEFERKFFLYLCYHIILFLVNANNRFSFFVLINRIFSQIADILLSDDKKTIKNMTGCAKLQELSRLYPVTEHRNMVISKCSASSVSIRSRSMST